MIENALGVYGIGSKLARLTMEPNVFPRVIKSKFAIINENAAATLG